MSYSKLILFITVAALSILLLLIPWSNNAQTKSGTDLAPVESNQDYSLVFWTAVRVAKSMPMWTLREVQFREGIILAEARTPKMNFIDDVKIELTGTKPVRVVVKSSSRVGLSDFGVNKRRIRAYLSALTKHLP